VFYDTTSLHFEIDEEDEAPAASDVDGEPSGGQVEDKPLRKRGYSKNGRGDKPQVVVGLAVTRDGLPVRHWVFPGNTVDVSTVARVKEDLRGWKLGRCVFVGDAGMVSKDNLRKLSLGGGKYIVSMPVIAGGEVAEKVMSRAGRFKTVADNLRVKEVVVGDGERRRRRGGVPRHLAEHPGRPSPGETCAIVGASRRGMARRAADRRGGQDARSVRPQGACNGASIGRSTR